MKRMLILLVLAAVLMCMTFTTYSQSKGSKSNVPKVQFGKTKSGKELSEFYVIDMTIKGNQILAGGYSFNPLPNSAKSTNVDNYIFELYSSIDGKIWEKIEIPEFVSLYQQNVDIISMNYGIHERMRRFYLTADNDYFYITHINDYGNYHKSKDGKSWQKITFPTPLVTGELQYIVNENLMVYPQSLGYSNNFKGVYEKQNESWNQVKLRNSCGNVTPHIYSFTKGNHHVPLGWRGTNNIFNKISHLPYKGYPNRYDLISEEESERNCEWAPFLNLFSPKENSQIFYALTAKNLIWRSMNGGASFESLEHLEELFSAVYRFFPICNSGAIFIAAKKNNERIPQFYFSEDNGGTWKSLEVYFPPEYGDLIHAANGITVIGTRGLLYLDGYGCKSGNNVPPALPIFGTTIITHGYQLGGAPPTSQSDWTFQMALEIIKKHGKGTIKTYDKSTGSFKENTIVGVGGETVLLFDWAAESNDNSQGYSEAAGDALFAALMMEQKKGNIKLENLHFIGHSRGTVVNTEAVERLITVINNSDTNAISIDQVTNLDSHDWGALDANLVKDNDNHPNINVPCPSDRRPNNGTISWKGSGFNDSYYQKGNPAIPLPIIPNITKSVVLDGRPVDGTYNVDWSKDAPGHSLVHERYLKTISSKNNAYLDGYKYSRISAAARPQPKICGGVNYSPEFDFFQPMKIFKSNSERIRGIMNGSFDRGSNEYSQNLPTTPGGQPQGYYYAFLPGWQYHGGSNPSESVEYKTDHIVLSNTLTPKSSKSLLRHNLFFVPKDAKAIAFKYKSLKPERGKLNIRIQSQTSTKRQEFSINIEKINPSFIEHFVDVSEFSQDVITLEFELISTGTSILSVALDDVRFDKNPAGGASTNPSQLAIRQTPIPTPPREMRRTWVGGWSGEGYHYDLIMNLTITDNMVTGSIIWKLRSSPRSEPQEKMRAQAIEYIRGTYDKENSYFSLEGYQKDDPHTIIDLDKYQLFLSPEGNRLSGKTATRGTWSGRLDATAK